jgi:hypothetical protein
VFQSDIRPPTATTTPPSAAETTATPSATAAPECGSPSRASEPDPTSRTHASGRPVIPGSRSRARAARSQVPCGSRPVCGLAITCSPVSRPVRVCTITAVRALSAIAGVRPINASPRPQPVGNRAASNRAGRNAGSSTGIAEPLLQVRIVVPRSLSMRRIVTPVLNMGAAIDVDASASPVDTAAAPKTTAAPVSAGCPPSERIGSTERETGRDHAGGDIAKLG